MISQGFFWPLELTPNTVSTVKMPNRHVEQNYQNTNTKILRHLTHLTSTNQKDFDRRPQ
ncbi:hypothetical protein M413DRAFT_348044 [Hebeloma cylindrosporum]|uniref:Uncharacterized protein n=1 Tax=Hebeloma cylindrosporum TaxID=76867 RepID=A0A0C2XCC7_HEBCY|nr:hypothetical protein M413DRAFT_348044 [Hebeloma cylindrosporum h7]